jgi:hypothetical protein
MPHYLSIALVLFSFAAARTPRAAHAVRASDANGIWTDEDLERLGKVPGLISVVGQPTNEVSQGVEAPAPQSRIRMKDPAWYAEQAFSLNAGLEAEQADLRGFTQAVDDVRELKSMPGGVNLSEDDIGITPEATIDILQNRVTETQMELDELEDLARRNGIPPGVFRGPWQGRAAENEVTAAEPAQYETSADGDDL